MESNALHQHPARLVQLMMFLSRTAQEQNVGAHTYVVGGAVRNFLMGHPIKDLDIVIDSVALDGKDSEWFARKLQAAIPVRTSLVTNQYGVSILSVAQSWELAGFEMKGETIEIANARKESYGGDLGKGYKPHMVESATIQDDLQRREFSVNTLLWRLSDLAQGPGGAEILDLTGVGRKHLAERVLSTPADPDKTFSDDSTRCLRAVKFMAKYGFTLAQKTEASIRRHAPKLKNMPWDAVRKILTDDILGGPNPRESVRILQGLGLASVLGEMLSEEPGFASALGRTLAEAPIHLILDLLDLGWPMKTPVSFLDQAGLVRLRSILLEHGHVSEFETTFLAYLKSPDQFLMQPALFTKYNIPPKERRIVVQIARTLLLQEPLLAMRNNLFRESVETALAQRFPVGG